jgi:putative hemin transport protein
MALTRNDAFVHERVGRYENFSAEGHVGLVVGDEIDLRIFLHHFAHAYAVTSEGPRDSRRSSLQFFDAHGRAMHKVFLREGSDHGAWARLVGRFAAQVDAGPLHVTPAPVRPAERHDSEIDVAGFRAAWLAMTDTHEFFGITRAFGVSRLQALRLAPPSHARRLATTRFSDVLRAAASSDLPIMVFVGSPGCIQIHTGPVERLVVVDGWFNVLDPRFNLHVREDLIDSAWHVTKPTADGDVNSIEYFDRDGQLLCMLFGARKPGKPERGDWRELASGAR